MIQLIKKKGINPITKAILYWLQWTRVATVDEKKLSKRMARGGTYSVGEVAGVMLDFPQHIADELQNGNAVTIEGLGTFKLRVQCKSSADPDKLTTRGAQVSVVFDPDPDLTARLNNKDEMEFKIVTAPTAEGQQDADSAETPTDQPSDTDPDGTGDNTDPIEG